MSPISPRHLCTQTFVLIWPQLALSVPSVSGFTIQAPVSLNTFGHKQVRDQLAAPGTGQTAGQALRIHLGEATFRLCAALCVTYNLPSGPCAAGTPLTSALPRSPLTGPGKRVCVMSAASVDRPYFWLQAAGPGGGARPQRLPLPDLRGLVQAGQYRRPLAPRGKAATNTCHHGDGASPLPSPPATSCRYPP